MSLRLRTTPLLLGAILAVAAGAQAARAAEDDRARPQTAEKVEGIAVASSASAQRGEAPLDLGVRAGAAAPRGLLAPGGLAVPVAETLATNVVMIEWNRLVGDARWANVSGDSIGRNLRSAWVLDDDDFWINQFGHPYQGTWSFTAARSSGLGFWASAPFTFAASALWELTGETTPPALNDQVTTTVAGIALGEILYRFAGALRAEGGAWNVALATVIAPMGALNQRLVGAPQTLAAPPSRWQLALGGARFTGPAAGGGGPLGYGGLSFTYGLPGSEDLVLARPFDHFALDLGWTPSPDPIATVRARGLVAGATFGAERARGLFGAFVSFDLDTPPGHRISTSAIGFGGSARADLGRALALEGDAIASAVLLGAGGTVDRGPEGRNYRFGPGEQALLFGAAGTPGTELLVQATASAAVRVVGACGIGLEVSRYVRRADVGGLTVERADSAVRLYLVLVGGA